MAQRLAAQGFTVLRPQPPDMTLATLADDVALAITRLGGPGPAVVVGHAYGHWVARVAESRHPMLVRGVVLLGAGARNFPSGLSAQLDIASDPGKPEADRLRALRQVMFPPGNDPRVWLTGWHPEWRAAYRAASQQPPKDSWFGISQAPVLDLIGEQDPWRPADTRTELQRLLPDKVTVQLIAGASHAMVPERPAGIAAAITAWVRGLR